MLCGHWRGGRVILERARLIRFQLRHHVVLSMHPSSREDGVEKSTENTPLLMTPTTSLLGAEPDPPLGFKTFVVCLFVCLLFCLLVCMSVWFIGRKLLRLVRFQFFVHASVLVGWCWHRYRRAGRRFHSHLPRHVPHFLVFTSFFWFGCCCLWGCCCCRRATWRNY